MMMILLAAIRKEPSKKRNGNLVYLFSHVVAVSTDIDIEIITIGIGVIWFLLTLAT